MHRLIEAPWWAKHLGHRLAPLLPVILALVLTVLEAACAPIAAQVRSAPPWHY